MNTYKLGNLIKKDLLKHFKNSQIHKQKFSFSHLKKLCETYAIREYVTDSYCCYGEDKCCWQEENLCWLQGAYPYLSNKELNKKIYFGFKRFFNSQASKKQLKLFKRKVFICENDKTIWFIVPLRDICKEDYFFVFDKTKLLEKETK